MEDAKFWGGVCGHIAGFITGVIATLIGVRIMTGYTLPEIVHILSSGLR